MKEKQIKAFMVFRETAFMLSLLSDEDAGKVIKAASHYFLYGVLSETSGQLGIVFDEAMRGVDRSVAAYNAKVEGGAKGGNAHWHKGKE